MDKRSLLLVFLMALTLLLFNTYLDYRSAGEREKRQKEQLVRQKKERALLEKKIAEKTAPLSALPLAQAEGFSALLFEEGALLLQKGPESPQELSFEGRSYRLLKESGEAGLPALYGKSSEAKLPFWELPLLGSYELQLFVPESGSTFYAEYRDGQLSLPLEKLAREFPEEYGGRMPEANALALIKLNGGYLPAGVYLASSQTFIPLESFSALAPALEAFEEEVAEELDQKERFYVLETPYQQLVFSNRGGALTEINLPLHEEDSQSVVKEIAFDREMVEKQPQNARFPLHPYYLPGESSEEPLLVAEGKLGGYYPLLRRDLIPRSGARKQLPESYRALNLVHPKYKEIENLTYRVKQFDKTKIVFEAEQPYRRITKTFSVAGADAEAPYCLTLHLKIEGDNKGLSLTSGVPEVEWISGASGAALKYRFTKGGKSEVESIALPGEDPYTTSQAVDWTCNSNGFLGLILDPLTQVGPGFQAIKVPGLVAPSRLLLLDEGSNRFKPEQLPGYMLLMPVGSKGSEATFRIFAGPFSTEILREVDKTFSNPETGYNPDYLASQTFHGWFAFISRPFAKFLLILLNLFHQLSGSWALSIVLLTVALRALLWPLNAWSTRSMLAMQQIAPELQALKKKYQKDPKKLQMATANLYRERGINPLMGCFPLLIQLPFLIGMFDLLKSTFELRGASFIPGWIDNLSAPDVLFSWSVPIFFIGTEFHALPFLLGATMYLQQKLSSTAPQDASLMTEQQKQQKMMAGIMPVLFALMFYNAPSGLCIYFISSTLLQFAQQRWTASRMKKRQT